MQNAYMVECELQSAFNEEFRLLVPRQDYVINQLMKSGIVLNYSLSMDRAKLWMVIDAESEFKVLEILSNMPLIEFMIPNISPLLFFNPARPRVEESLPFSLN